MQTRLSDRMRATATDKRHNPFNYMTTMRLYDFILAAAVLSGAVPLTGCEGEKDLVIIEGNLPIKTSTLYMVGDATPNGWSIDSPTPLTAGGEDPLVFEWEGELSAGEMKLCLTTGSWDAPFIRPVNAGEAIGAAPISEAVFTMHAGDPDDKWKVVESGVYHLTFNLRDWTMSSEMTGGAAGPDMTPIKTDNLYMVGDATPAGWNIDAPYALSKTSEYIFEYEGPLTAGEMKLCTSAGSWDTDFIRPASDGVQITRDGVAEPGFIYTANPDNKWKVADPGVYRLVFDLENHTLSAQFKSETVSDRSPIETESLFMIGDATPGGWSMDDATPFTCSGDYLWTWEGELVQGSFKACTERDGTFSCPFIRPASASCTVSENGVSDPDFVYTTSPDDQWSVTRAGRYRISFDLREWTIAVTCLSAPAEDNPSGPDAIETRTLYIIGDATPGGWSMDDLTAMTPDTSDPGVFTWTGHLATGEMKACLSPDPTFSCPFLRPSYDGCVIDASGVADASMVYTVSPDDKWRVGHAGEYRLTFNLNNMTLKAECID